MYETENDLQRLQDVLDRSIEQAGPFLRDAFEMPEHSLSARQLVQFWGATQTIALATVTSKGEPRVAPIAAMLLRGELYVPTVASAIRTKHVKRSAGVSFTCYEKNDVAVIVHGDAQIIDAEHAEFEGIDRFVQETTTWNIQTWGAGGEGVFLHIVPRVLYTYARYPEKI